MRLTRCYVPPPLQAHTDIALPASTALHVARVLRLAVGGELTVFDGRGGEYAATITAIRRDEVRIALGPHRPIEREAPVRVTLMQSLARGERMDLIVQKATELGVNSIMPLSSQHSVVRLRDSAASRRGQHWRQVAISACEQCGRNRIPSLADVAELTTACGALEAHTHRYILHPEAAQSLTAVLQRDLASAGRTGTESKRDFERAPLQVALLLGPEGGWSREELALAERFDFRAVHLGPRVLRAETAPLAALAIVQGTCGDMR